MTTLTRQGCIEYIRHLPDRQLEKHGIRIGFSYQQKDSWVLKAAREEYDAKARWLEYLWLDKLELLPELTFTWKVEYKPFANRTCSFLDLAQELYPRLAWAQEQRLVPLLWTLHCEIEICGNKLFNSGYTSDKALQLGKVENSKLARGYYRDLENTSQLHFLAKEAYLEPIKALEVSAAYIAKTDAGFRNNAYCKYIATQRSYHRSVEKSNLNVIQVGTDGSAEMGGKGRDAKPRQSRKTSLRQSGNLAR
jgi:hypothetical protein